MRRPHIFTNSMGYEVADWYWQVREHVGSHYNCHPLANGLCAIKVVRYENWNGEAQKWELEPMVNAATPEQCKVLNGK